MPMQDVYRLIWLHMLRTQYSQAKRDKKQKRCCWPEQAVAPVFTVAHCAGRVPVDGVEPSRVAEGQVLALLNLRRGEWV